MESAKYAFDSGELQRLLGGYWYLGDADKTKPELFYVNYFTSSVDNINEPGACFLAWDEETWLKGSGNTGHFATLAKDTHMVLEEKYFRLRIKDNLCGVIAQHPIEKLKGVLPQLIVPDSYVSMKTLAEAARSKAAENCTVIAVTGAVGKSTTTMMLHCLMHDESDYISNTNGHNSRSGVALRLTETGRFNPEFRKPGDKPNVCVLEVAASALWMRDGGVCKMVRPHIGIITQVALTQYQEGSRNIHDVAITKSKICQGVVPGGKAVLYRDMPEFDFVRESVINYGAAPVTYGEDPDCDTYLIDYKFEPPTAGDEIGELFTNVNAVILGERLSYTIGAIGKPVVLNSMAALTAAKLAGFDIKKIAGKLAGFKGNANVLQISNCNGVCIVNNSHNLEMPSIVSAFDLLKQIKQKHGGRKIVLMSRMDNLGEKAPELHLQLTELITESGFDKFFFHEPLNEFSLLIKTIPEEMSGGRYKLLEDAANAASDYVRAGDSLLAIGSHFTSDFGDVYELLTKGIRQKSQMPSSSAAVLAFSADKNRIVYRKGGESAKYQGGLGLPLLLYHVLDLVRKGDLSWEDEVAASENAANEARHPKSLGLAHLEKVNMLTLFQAAVVANSPDACVALAGHVYVKIGESKNRTIIALRKIGESWGIPESAINNITGRFYERNPQYFTPDMLLKAARNVFSFDMKDLTCQKNLFYNGKYFESSFVFNSPPVSRCFSFSTGSSINTACMCEYGDETVYFAVCGAKTELERDSLLLEAIHRARTPLPEPLEEFMQTGKTALTICGDTYCGERYTKWRAARNIDDPMQRYGDVGYVYSFEKVAPLISRDTYNIVNSECVLSPAYNETQQTGKYIDFVLGAHPEKTIACYKMVNINAVMLANNHSMDFGAAGNRQTRRYFAEAGLNPTGSGANIDEAETPLLLELNGRGVIVFNAYCYFADKRHRLFRHYCLGSNTGTAFGTDVLDDISLWRRITAYRKKHANAFIVFSPHWSTDFNARHEHLRPIAEKAFEAGADLIIGHGPHIPLGMEYIGGKLCVYSIGNFVFNTTGVDLDASGQSPFGIVSRLDFSAGNPELRLYPIYAHNLNTFFQPYPVTDREQYEKFSAPLMGTENFEICEDGTGYYLRAVL